MTKIMALLICSTDPNFIHVDRLSHKFPIRENIFCEYHFIDNNLSNCSDTGGLIKDLRRKHNPEKWRLFIDTSIFSLRAVLLHNGNMYIIISYHGIFSSSKGKV